eukprot:CAMPEP_0196801538 /NCGR_PEP_ID=MMETSP1362-20130617/1310_1 /TAXON_ID=163516 /ORGANISM="Leptocylindrus danicus, Strain CCMP1856" /LENGTH=88 /DNA_ID=CAMNT_0042172559 /DNA_START=58 /DNA_END=321 /DNA_ORIENTATION=+
MLFFSLTALKKMFFRSNNSTATLRSPRPQDEKADPAMPRPLGKPPRYPKQPTSASRRPEAVGDVHNHAHAQLPSTKPSSLVHPSADEV